MQQLIVIVTVKMNVYRYVPYFKVEDGSFDYAEYQPVCHVFELSGAQLHMSSDGEPLSEEEFAGTYNSNASFKMPNSHTEGIENLENYSISNSVYETRGNYETVELTDLENKLMDAVFASENIKISDGSDPFERFYQFSVNAKRINGKIYVSYQYCNKKNFMSQYSVKSGYRSSVLFSYDEADGTVEELLRLGKQSCIMAFSDTKVTYYKNDQLICKDLVGGGETVLLKKLPPYVYATAFADRLMLTASDGDPHYPDTDTHTYVYDLNGTLLSEG